MTVREAMRQILGEEIASWKSVGWYGMQDWMNDLEGSSEVGRRCIHVFEKTRDLLQVCDPSLSVRQSIMEGVDLTCRIFYFG